MGLKLEQKLRETGQEAICSQTLKRRGYIVITNMKRFNKNVNLWARFNRYATTYVYGEQHSRDSAQV